MPEMTSTQRQVLALCSLVSAGDRCDWGVLARQAHRERSLDGLLAGDILETSANAHRTGWVIKTASAESWTAAWERADSEYRAATAAGARLTTVLDDDFPLNLRLIHNLPPFLFYRGSLDADRDAHSVAVVGTRSATPDGVRQTRRVVRSLTHHRSPAKRRGSTPTRMGRRLGAWCCTCLPALERSQQLIVAASSPRGELQVAVRNAVPLAVLSLTGYGAGGVPYISPRRLDRSRVVVVDESAVAIPGVEPLESLHGFGVFSLIQLLAKGIGADGVGVVCEPEREHDMPAGRPGLGAHAATLPRWTERDGHECMAIPPTKARYPSLSNVG